MLIGHTLHLGGLTYFENITKKKKKLVDEDELVLRKKSWSGGGVLGIWGE